MFKIVIVDDDRQMQAIIRDKIKEKTDAFRDAKIQIFSSAEAFLAEAKQEEHGEEGDLFFVDIELGDGITGLEFGRILRKKYPNRGLVFLTSHKEFAMESYEIEADQYILKEQMDKRLPGILEKLMYRLGAERNQYRMLRNEDGEQKIYFREMICIHKRKMGKYAEFETFQGTFRERISLDRLLEELDSKEFFLADRSNIINLRNVQSIRDNVICLEEGHTLELNQYRTVLEKRYLQTWQKILIWGNILGMGIVLGVNRNMLFFSSAMLWGCIVFTMLIALFLHVKKWKLIAEIVGIYFLFVALLDFFFFFCRMAVENDVYYVFYKGDYFVDKSILYILSRISISVMLICFKKEKKGESILKKTQMFLLITAGILVVIVTGYHFLIYDILNGLSDISGWSAACSLLAIFVVVAFCLGISWKNQSLKQENQILEVREKLELDNMRDMTKALEQNRIQVHDMRHHMIILREYALKKEYEAIETYLDQLLESYVEVQEERWTRIRNLDILLSEKKKEANLENIRFQIETDVLQSLPFKETETSVLFGNLLDNAIEACKKMKTETRWIRVEIRQRKGFLFFTIANSIGKRPQEKDGQFVSDKEDKKVHGYGLKSIRRIVKKYGGSFQCDVVEEEVKISISFSNK